MSLLPTIPLTFSLPAPPPTPKNTPRIQGERLRYSSTKKKRACYYLMFSLCCLSLPTFAHTGKGWQWYDDTQALTPKPAPSVETVHTPTPAHAPPSYTAQLKAWQANFAEAKAAAVMAPTPEHLYRLQSLIEASWAKTHQLADAWQQTLLRHPELDYNATHPTGERAKAAFFEQKNASIEATMAKLAREGAGLFLVFKSTDVYLHEFATQVRQLANGEHLPLLGVSLDGSPLPELSDVRANNGKLQVSVTPALILVKPSTHQHVAVSYGINSIETIKRQIHFIENGYHDTP